jgi:hypothetical protein
MGTSLGYLLLVLFSDRVDMAGSFLSVFSQQDTTDRKSQMGEAG